MKAIITLGRFVYHHRRGAIALARMVAILELFNDRFDQARAACPSIDRHRIDGRRHVRLARFYRRRSAIAARWLTPRRPAGA